MSSLPTRRRGETRPASKSSKSDASKNGGGNMPGTEDADDEDGEVIVSKAPPPAHGTYRMRVSRCAYMKNKEGMRVKDKKGEELPPKLEMVIDDPAEIEKARKGEVSQQGVVVGQLLDFGPTWRGRTNKLCTGLGFPEAEWPESKKYPGQLVFPMKQIDALKEQVDGRYRYFTGEVKTQNGTGENKDTPYTNLTSITAWVPPRAKPGKANGVKVKEADEPDPQEPDSQGDDQSEPDSDEPGDPDDQQMAGAGGPADDDIPF